MEEVRKETNNKGNVILLTVIAIVTMIIVLVGATFAYLASSVADEDSANINATTSGGSDMFLINAGSDIEIFANVDNFYEGAGDISDSVDASVTLQTTSSSNISYNYKVYLDVKNNDFEYTSGTCYRKDAAPIGGVTTKQACADNNATNIWATTDGTAFACYGTGLSVVTGALNNNEIGCLTSPSNIWAPDEVAELVLDLYKSDSSITTQAACELTGICVDKLHNATSATTASACNTDPNNTWVPSIYENNICYKTIQNKDLTVSGVEVISLLDNQTITANNSTKGEDYYKATVKLINYGHNQVANGDKTFNGILTFERITN